MTGYVVELDPSDPRCCEKAAKRLGACVCRFVMVCPQHGEKHVGRH